MASVAELVIQLLGLALSVRAATHPGLTAAQRRPWRVIAVSWALLPAASVALIVPVEGAPGWWVHVLARLVHAPVMVAGLSLFPGRRLTRVERAGLGLDLVAIAGAAYVLADRVRPTGPDPLMVADLILLLGVCATLLRGAVTGPRQPLATLLIGLMIFIVAGGNADVNAVGNAIGQAVMALAAGRQIRHATAPPPGAAVRERYPAALPYLAVALGCALLVADGPTPWVGLIVMTGAVTLRQWLLARENRRLLASDALTGLANRARLRAELDWAVERGDGAVLLFDLDGFRQVNDAYGPEAGDAVLVGFAGVLRRALRRGDLAARLGADEFAVVLSEVTGPDQAIIVAERILEGARAAPSGPDGAGIRASAGIALTEPGLTGAEVLQHADAAMQEAKRRHSHGWEIFAQSEEALQEGLLADELAAAVRLGQLTVHYQPIVDIASGRMIGAEALVRWVHPVRGRIYPDVFIPLAERTGVIAELGMFVLEEAARRAQGWRSALPGFYVSVNLSPHQLRRPGLVEEIAAVLARTGLPPDRLVLELTESALVADRTDISVLERLRAHGIRIAVDDFGTGYSSLRYLTRLPVDVLKLDRCFVGELNGRPEGSAVTEAVIRLSQILRLRLIAEGVETEAQARELLLLGCATGQGYLFARPMEAEAVDRLIGEMADQPVPR